MLYRLILCLCVGLLAVAVVPAQRGNGIASVRADDRADDDDKGPRLGRLEDEMLRKRRIEEEKKQYRDHLTRAREAATLGTTLRENFARQQALLPDDFKKVERVEKLARGIRKNMSEESDPVPLETPPATLSEGLERLAVASEQLDKLVKETPRNVVSAAVLEQACEVESLARYVRDTWGRKDD